MLMTRSPYFTIGTPLFNSFLISIADTRTFNSPLSLNRTRRFLDFLMFSSNANLTTLFPLSSTERKRSLDSTLNGILLHLENTKLTSSAHLLIVVCESVHHPVCYSLLLDDLKRHLSRNRYPRGTISFNTNDVVNKHRNKPKDIITVPKKEIFIVLPYLGIQSKIVTQQLKSCIYKFYGCFNPMQDYFLYKDRLSRSLRSKVVYKASCWDCDDYYIGKTKRRLQDRKTEHFRALTSNSHSSAIADHMTQTGHRIKWDHFDILATGQK